MDFGRVPSDFRYIVQRACEVDPARRYPTVQAMFEDLEMVTGGGESLQRPLALVKALVHKVGLRQEAPEALAKALINNLDDNAVLMNALPEIAPPILARLFSACGTTMLEVLKRYDAAVSERLPFDYCDVVANFYEKVLNAGAPPEVRSLVLRLPVLGFSHNRYHVGEVLARIVASLSDTHDLLTLRDVLRENPDAAAWCKTYLERTNLPSVIRAALQPPEEIPF